MAENIWRVWCIGSDRTEYFAARSEEEVRTLYIGMVGDEQATEDFEACFLEVTDYDKEFDFDEDGTKIRTTWRKLLDDVTTPTQVSSGYY